MARLAVVALLCVPLACARFGARERDPVEADYAEAVALADVDPARATNALRRFLESHPRASRADDAALALADLLAGAGEVEPAMTQLRWARQVHARGDRIPEIRLRLAELELESGDAERAASTAQGLVLDELPDAARVRAMRLLAALAAEAGETTTQLGWLAALRDETPDPADRVVVEAEIEAVLARLSGPDLDAGLAAVERRSPIAAIHLRLAEVAISAGDTERAREHLERLDGLALSVAETERRQLLLDRLTAVPEPAAEPPPLPATFARAAAGGLPETRAAEGTIGVVVPLSGPFAGFGEECLRGALLAARVFEDAEPTAPASRVRVVVRDSGGDAAGAAAAVRALATDPALVAIVGPLLGSEAEAAAEAAERAGVPLLTLTSRSEVAIGRSNVFRVGRSPRSEVRVLTDFALDDLGVGRFAILYPDDEYGRGQKDLFFDVVEERGGRIVGLAAYDPSATDFAGSIRRLIGYYLLSGEEIELLEERERMLDRAKKLPADEALELRTEARELVGPDEAPLPPIVAFDALFLPDSYEKVALIAPQLAFHEAGHVQLLGPNGWYHPDLIRIGGRHVDGAVFTETFHPESDIPYVADFARRYQARFGRAPGPLAAISYDAASLVLVQLARGLRTREALREGLLGVESHPGVSGVTSIARDGNAHKRPFLLNVNGKRIESLE